MRGGNDRPFLVEVRVMGNISWDDFENVGLRVGTIAAVQEFPEARKPR